MGRQFQSWTKMAQTLWMTSAALSTLALFYKQLKSSKKCSSDHLVVSKTRYAVAALVSYVIDSFSFY